MLEKLRYLEHAGVDAGLCKGIDRQFAAQRAQRCITDLLEK
ncbi:hypothetical protein LW976_17730 [Erwinia amylovora]|nr:hypothetical protein [Erwinia amylovora]